MTKAALSGARVTFRKAGCEWRESEKVEKMSFFRRKIKGTADISVPVLPAVPDQEEGTGKLDAGGAQDGLSEGKAPAAGLVQVICNIDDVLNYAIVHNGERIIRDICVKNLADEELESLTVQIVSDDGIIAPLKKHIDRIGAHEEVHIRAPEVPVNTKFLVSLTERAMCRISAGVYCGDKLLASDCANITVLAFDEWAGLRYTPELLASFVMPNHPVVVSLMQLASKYLKKWTGNPSLAGYQYGGPDRVNDMAAAAYAAIQQKNITYAEPPSSFEDSGQRIRLADAVLDLHLGTCLDLTLLYAACLEGMGLNPVLVMMKGHVFAGVWLTESSFPDTVTDDPSQLQKRMSRGINEMTVVECTAMCAGHSISFDDAVKTAQTKVADYASFAFAIDVKRARSMGIRPLPVRTKTEGGFEVAHEERKGGEVTEASRSSVEVFDLPVPAGKEKATKLAQWERKLLDLSLRNMLINMRMTSAVVPLLSSNISVLEDALSDGEEFRVLPRPDEMQAACGVSLEGLRQLGQFEDYIKLEGRSRRLHSLYAEKELNACLTKMYRSARTSMEENGASTLYLALGVLRWLEAKGATPRYAPIVLVPIDIVRKSANSGYAMRMRDEDAQINITLLEFLKQEFGLEVYGLTPPPTDEHGLDMPKIFAILRRAIMNMQMWDVVEAGFIGNFTFSQFVMWNDIHSNSAFLEGHKIVRSLMNGAVDWDCTIPESVSTDEAYLPVTVDSSQLRAINMAAGDVSFVLHGPPGTGKSQAITAMIANALTKGKTVLFVAEKMAALEVVQRRLASLRIDGFCLELHSNKATKKSVLDQLKRGLETAAGGAETNYEHRIETMRHMRADLDAYAQALHAVRPFGWSLRELIDLYESIPESGKGVRFDRAFAASITENELESSVHSLERLVAAGRGIGHPHGHPLSGVLNSEYRQSMKFSLVPAVRAYLDALLSFRSAARRFTDIIGIKPPAAPEEWKTACSLAQALLGTEAVPGFLRSCADLDREFSAAEAYVAQASELAARKAGLLAKWSENFLKTDIRPYREKYDRASRKLFGRSRAMADLTSELRLFASFDVETDLIPAYLTDIAVYQQEAAEVKEAEEALSYEWKRLAVAHPTPAALNAYKEDVRERARLMERFSSRLSQLEAEGSLGRCTEAARALDDGAADVKACEEKVAAMLELAPCSDPVEERITMCECIVENYSSVKDWIFYRQCAEECRNLGLGPVCDAYEAGLAHEDVKNVYLRSLYRAMILSVIESEPVLNGFTGTGFNEKIAQFKKLDAELMELTKDEMAYRLMHQLPSSSESVEISRELNTLRRAITSNGRGLSVRSLFEQIPHVLTRLCPCMLMSPISAAQYLQPKNDLFDIVIFDEASQLPTCKAVGVLARGRNAVIVGDPNQMPPTSFFAGNFIDEDNLDIEDLDSILDDCLALGMPSAYLHWHYRSRHESLIAFSNREFYENSMYTFPSVNDRERKVSFVMSGGFFDRGGGRVNRAEAAAIVAEIKRRYSDAELTGQSIGVVTFNISQQSLIEDLLQEEFSRDSDFDRWANASKDPLFVKNLENVQGDERDVILFSIAFGPDADGKLSLNFGPINKNGGWKRLNVAVTRARCEMVVFSSMTSDMIELKRTRSKGVEALKDFLEYAQKGVLQGEASRSESRRESGITEHICAALAKAGYGYQTSVGHSRFRIDIAVVNPYDANEYLLGIMLDGDSYRQSKNTKDREVAQISVLAGLGWKIHRIWTMDWWDNRDRELSRLMSVLEERKNEAYKTFLETAPSSVSGQGASNVTQEGHEADPEPAGAGVPGNGAGPEGAKGDKGGTGKAVTAGEGAGSVTAGGAALKSANGISPAAAASGSGEQDAHGGAPVAKAVYRIEDYVPCCVEATVLPAGEFVKKENLQLIADRMQKILDAEAPVVYGALVKKTLRACGIPRSTAPVLEAADKAFRKVSAKLNKQAGARFCWRKDQDPGAYSLFRKDAPSDRRSPEEICAQELKNAVCFTLQGRGSLDRDSLVRETVRSMGYSRSSSSLASAVERGLKHGLKTGEIVTDADNNYSLAAVQ